MDIFYILDKETRQEISILVYNVPDKSRHDSECSENIDHARSNYPRKRQPFQKLEHIFKSVFL